MKKPPAAPRRILFEAATLLAVHFGLLHLLARARLLEHLLAPGSHSFWAIAATAAFLLLRFFLYVISPGWLICRLWLWYARRCP